MEITKGYQGKIGAVKSRNGNECMLWVYSNSSDFPDNQIIIMTAINPENIAERVAITEEIWRNIGKALGYKFVHRKKKV